MRPLHHEASVNKVNYKYYEPKGNSEGKFKGVMYEKYDKKTDEKKQASDLITAANNQHRNLENISG